tara:strand:- start:94 stop:408 length:315 start_codon:yes stop_codon:yes gene_type:complete
MKMTLLDAMEALGVGGYIKNNDFDSIVWANPSETVSREVLEAKLSELQAEYDSKQYQRDRETSYPEIKEQLDLLYHDMTAGKGDKTGEWYKAVKKVKTDNPKPE